MTSFEPIRIAQIEAVSVRLEPEGYRFFKKPSKNGKIKNWVASKLWGLLHKWHYLEQYYTFCNTHTYGFKEYELVTEALFGVLNGLAYRGKNFDDYALVMGSAEFYELTHIGILNHHTFPIQEIRYENRRDDTGERYRASYQGLMVHVVSTVSGIHAIPKIFIEKKEREGPKSQKMVMKLPYDEDYCDAY